MEKINWVYADKFGELTSGQAEQVEAMVQIAEQLNELNNTMLELLIQIENKPMS